MAKLNDDEELIVDALKAHTLCNRHQLNRITGLGSGRLVPALTELENTQRIASRWDKSSHPHHRCYKLAQPQQG